MYRTLLGVFKKFYIFGIEGPRIDRLGIYGARFSGGIELDDSYTDEETSLAINEVFSGNKKPNKTKPEQPPNAQILKVAIIGAPNAGKSTLANKLIGHRFAAVSSKVHTTRESVAGVWTEFNKQLIFLDTPGMIHPSKRKRHKLERTLLIDPHASLFQADIIAVVADVSNPWGRSQLDKEILKALHLHSHKKSVLILNKVDTMKNKEGLFRVTRLLSAGIVDGKQESVKASTVYNKTSRKDLFNKMDRVKGLMAGDSREGHTPTRGENVKGELQDGLPDFELVQGRHAVGSHTKNSVDDFNKDTVPDLWNSQDWHNYHTRLKEVNSRVLNLKGWPGFSAVFMISALDGDGVNVLKDYFMKITRPGDWVFDRKTVSTAEPLEIAKMCVWEKILDRVPNDIAYVIKVVPKMWEETEDGLLCASFDIVCKYNREAKPILGPQGDTIRKISLEVKQELMNTFRREMSLKLAVVFKK